MATTKPTYKEPGAYQSQYSNQIASGIDKVTNREAFSYDPLKDANYQAMAKIYNQQGNKAAKDTLGDAASLNGGYGSSYAVTASQQARNDYNQQLASQIPALEQAAYSRYMDEYNMDRDAVNLYLDMDDRDYGRYRDDVADSQWKFGQDYQAYRDDVGDSQWQKSYDRSVFESNRDYNYQKERDKVADSQWAKEYALSKKSAASSGGSSGGGYIGGGSVGDDGFDQYWDDANEEPEENNNNKPKTSKYKNVRSKTYQDGIWGQFIKKQQTKK